MASSVREELASLIDRLREAEAPPAIIALMPDFFLDCVVRIGSFRQFTLDAQRVIAQGGGNIPTRQTVMRGGNAANTAAALAAVGLRPRLITRTSQLGLAMLRLLVGDRVDLSHVKTDGQLASTTALEVGCGKRLANVMLSHPASIANFGFSGLDGKDLALLREANVVCVFNWNLNRRGTDLAHKVFKLVKEEGRGRTYFDSGDPSPRLAKVPELLREVVLTGLVDVFSLNENEAKHYAAYLDEGLRRAEPSGRLALRCARVLGEGGKARVDLHTADFSATLERGEEFVAPTFSVPTERLTGAGDAWNAANIFAECLGLTPIQRLLFANAAAAYYVSNPIGKHASVEDVIRILSRGRLRRVSL